MPTEWLANAQRGSGPAMEVSGLRSGNCVIGNVICNPGVGHKIEFIAQAGARMTFKKIVAWLGASAVAIPVTWDTGQTEKVIDNPAETTIIQTDWIPQFDNLPSATFLKLYIWAEAPDGLKLPFNGYLTPVNQYPELAGSQGDQLEYSVNGLVVDRSADISVIPEAPSGYNFYLPLNVCAQVEYAAVPTDLAPGARATLTIGDSRSGNPPFLRTGGSGFSAYLIPNYIPFGLLPAGGSNAAAFSASLALAWVQDLLQRYRVFPVGYGINSMNQPAAGPELGDATAELTFNAANGIRALIPHARIVLIDCAPVVVDGTTNVWRAATHSLAAWKQHNQRLYDVTTATVPGLVAKFLTRNQLYFWEDGKFNLVGMESVGALGLGDGIHLGDLLNALQTMAGWAPIFFAVYGKQSVIGPAVISAQTSVDGRTMYYRIAGDVSAIAATDGVGITVPADGGTSMVEAEMSVDDYVLVAYPNKRVASAASITPTVVGSEIEDSGSGLPLEALYPPFGNVYTENLSTWNGVDGGGGIPPEPVPASSYVGNSGKYMVIATDAEEVPLSPEYLAPPELYKFLAFADGNRRRLLRGARSGDRMVLTMNGVLGEGKTVEFQYLGGGLVEDNNGADMLAFPKSEIDNNSTAVDSGDESSGKARAGSKFVGSPFVGAINE